LIGGSDLAGALFHLGPRGSTGQPVDVLAAKWRGLQNGADYKSPPRHQPGGLCVANFFKMG